LSLQPLGIRTFLVLAAVYLYSFPFFSQLRSANELPRVLMTQEIVERGTMRLDARMGELGSRFDIAPVPPEPHYYPNKAPGPSFLAVPVYVLCKILGATSTMVSTWAFRVAVSTLPALLFLWYFYRLSGRFAQKEPARRLALVALAFGSPFLPYALLFMSHTPAAVTAGSAFFCAVSTSRGETSHPGRMAFLAGLLAGLSVMMDYQSIIAAAGVAFYLLVRGPRRLRHVGLLSLGAAPAALALAGYHKAAFGSVLKTGYNFSNAAHNEGLMGLVGPSLEAFDFTVLDPSNGLLVLCPWVVFAIVGFFTVMFSRDRRRRSGAEAVTCFLLFAAYLLFLSSLIPFFARAGWSVGPRYITVVLPFVAWLAVPAFEVFGRFFVTRVLAWASVLVSAVIFVSAATTYPHWPEALKNPLYELAFRLIRDGYAVHSVGTALGLRGHAAMVPHYVLASCLCAWLVIGHKRRLVSGATAIALTVGVLLWLHGQFPLSGPYAQRAYDWIVSTWEPPPKRAR
jgi:hypothetical protein